MSEWTPGPWKSPDDDTDMDDVTLFALVADFHDHNDDVDEQEACGQCNADARLIAAAPEMAELLEDLSPLHHDDDDVPDHEYVWDLATKARALLARIKGES
jgi:hypothetical protein